MVGVTLLVEAQAAGLTVSAEDDRLVIRGPKSAEPLALRLLAQKAEVLRALRQAPASQDAQGLECVISVKSPGDAGCTRCGSPLAPDNSLYCNAHRDRMIDRFGPDFGETMRRVSADLAQRKATAAP
jgi:hypothetical protein